jgi:hypothetical protein
MLSRTAPEFNRSKSTELGTKPDEQGLGQSVLSAESFMSKKIIARENVWLVAMWADQGSDLARQAGEGRCVQVNSGIDLLASLRTKELHQKIRA